MTMTQKIQKITEYLRKHDLEVVNDWQGQDRWYIDRISSKTLDRRGNGYRTQVEALEEALGIIDDDYIRLDAIFDHIKCRD